jgi:selenide,water dikinase
LVHDLPKFDHPDLIIGPDGFSDAGVYRLRDDLLIVQTLDFFPPLIDDPFVFGQIAAANSLSDAYAMGARPVTALNIVGFPDDRLELDLLGQILQGGADRVRQAGAVIAGGHTVRDVEIKYGLSVTGVVEPERLMTNRAARPGDKLVLTKPLGTGFVTTAYKAGRCPQEVLDAATRSMAMLNAAACQAAGTVGSKAATDITGFGLAGHACEMAEASGVTMAIHVSLLPLLPGSRELAERGNKTRASATNRNFVEPQVKIDDHVDPLSLEFTFDAQTSGGLLISVAADQADRLVDLAREGGAHAACVVGEVLPQTDVRLVLHP